MPDYVEMLCKNYIARLLKSRGWDTESKTVPNNTITTTASSASLKIQNIIACKLKIARL